MWDASQKEEARGRWSGERGEGGGEGDAFPGQLTYYCLTGLQVMHMHRGEVICAVREHCLVTFGFANCLSD